MAEPGRIAVALACAALVTVAAPARPRAAERWLTCPDGRLADLRPDGPLAVLSESVSESLEDPPFATKFALYRDGLLIARRGPSLWRWRLDARRLDSLLGALALDDLDRVDSHPLRGVRLPSDPEHAYEAPIGAALDTWNGGCHRAIGLHRLSLLALRPDLPGLTFSRRGPRPRTERARFARLPPPLQRALRTMLDLAPPPDSRRLCTWASCFSRELTLPYQDAWLKPDWTTQ